MTTETKQKPASNKYYIQTYGEWGTPEANNPHFKEVKGKKVVIPGYEDMDFFVSGETGNWGITEASTGLGMGQHAETIKEAISKAKKAIDYHGRSAFDREIAKSEKTPRHQEAMSAIRQIKIGYGHPLYQDLLKDTISESELKSRVGFWKKQEEHWNKAVSAPEWKGHKKTAIQQRDIYRKNIREAEKELGETVPKINVGDVISDGLVSGKVLGDGILKLGRNEVPAYKIEIQTGHEKGKTDLIIKNQVERIIKPVEIPKRKVVAGILSAQNAAIHAWYDDHPESDKLSPVKVRRSKAIPSRLIKQHHVKHGIGITRRSDR